MVGPGGARRVCSSPDPRNRWAAEREMRPLQAAQWKMHLVASPRGEGFKGKAVLASHCFLAPLSNPYQAWTGC